MLRAAFLTPRQIDREQSRYLDAWRGGSAIAVLISHTIEIFAPDTTQLATSVGHAAVMIFFAISGFFIHKSLAASFAKNDPMRFVASRVNRVIPPFLFSLMLVVLLWESAPALFPTASPAFVHPAAGKAAFSLAGLLPTALLLNRFVGPTLAVNVPLWSLTYEVWYYAGLFLLALLLSGRRWVLLAAPVFVVLVLRDHAFLYLSIVWIGGVVVSILHSHDRLPRIPLWIPALVMLVAGRELYGYTHHRFDDQWLTHWRWAVGLLFLLHLTSVVRGERVPVVPLLPATAAYSYSLYVLHFPILLFIYGATGMTGWIGVPAAIAAFGVAATIGRRLERWRPIGEGGQAKRGPAVQPA